MSMCFAILQCSPNTILQVPTMYLSNSAGTWDPATTYSYMLYKAIKVHIN